MRKLYSFLLLFLPFSIYSQTIEQLEYQREEITSQIEQLKDSLLSVENKIESVKREKQNGVERDEVEVKPEIPQLRIPEDIVLKSLPGELGKKVMGLEEGTVVQKIDEVKDHYLVCISGNCGYLAISIFAEAAKDKSEKKK